MTISLPGSSFVLQANQQWFLSKVVVGPWFLLSLWCLSLSFLGFNFNVGFHAWGRFGDWGPVNRLENKDSGPHLGPEKRFYFSPHLLAPPPASGNPALLAESCPSCWEYWPPGRISLSISVFYFTFSLRSHLFFLPVWLRAGSMLSAPVLCAQRSAPVTPPEPLLSCFFSLVEGSVFYGTLFSYSPCEILFGGPQSFWQQGQIL